MQKIEPRSIKSNFLLNATRFVLNLLVPLLIFPYVSRMLGVENISKVEFANSVVSNLNAAKLTYAVTSEGMEEIISRGKSFMKRTFKIAEEYNGSINQKIEQAKQNEKQKLSFMGIVM